MQHAFCELPPSREANHSLSAITVLSTEDIINSQCVLRYLLKIALIVSVLYSQRYNPGFYNKVVIKQRV